MKQGARHRAWIAIVSLVGLLLILWLTRGTEQHDLVSGPIDAKSQSTDPLPNRVKAPPDGVPRDSLPVVRRTATRSSRGKKDRDGADKQSWVLEALVTDRAKKVPVAEAIVSVETVYSEVKVAICETNSEGRCKVKLGSGTFMAAAEHALYHRVSKAIAPPLASGVSAQVELPLRRKVQIQGVVRNQFGEPVPSANLVFDAYMPEEISGWFGRGMTTSDDEGFFECSVIAGQLRALAHKPGHKEWQRWITVAGEDTPPVVVTLEQTSPVFRVSGTVRDPLKQPVPGAEVCVETDFNGEKYCVTHAETDKEGFYSNDAVGGEKTFVVKAPGFDEARAVVDLKRDQELDFMLQALPSFKVRVLDWTGEVISNVRLFGTFPDGSSPDRSSRWIFGPGQEPNTFDSRVYPFLLHVDALDSGAGIALPILVSEYRPEITVQLDQGGHIFGRVVDTDYGIVTRFHLSLRGPDGIGVTTRRHAQDGSFRLDHLPPGDYRITVQAQGSSRGRASETVSIEIGQTAIVEMVLAKSI